MIFNFFSARTTNGSRKDVDMVYKTREKLIAFISNEMKKYQKDERNIGAIILKIYSLKQIVNTHGFRVSDNFLASTINNIHGVLKSQDSVHRINEDELVIILPGILNEGHLLLAANRIMQLFDNQIILEKKPITVRIAMGAALFPELSDDAEDLLLKSSIALEEAIDKGVPYKISRPEESTSIQSSLIIESQLRNAIESNELEVHYQPKLDIKNRTIVGAEALARWNHPVHGLLPPNYLLAIAEKLNLINNFTSTILNTALKQAREWRGIGADVGISINLTSSNLLDDTLIENIQRAITLWEIPPGKLMFEISENAIMTNPDVTLPAIQNINAIGVRCSIDDFGTGSSALAYLKKLPVSELKIDQSFISNLLEDERDSLLVDSIIYLAHNFHFQVTAEGVSNEEILSRLAHMNCDIAQGFHIAKPMPNAQFKQWMKGTNWKIRPL